MAAGVMGVKEIRSRVRNRATEHALIAATWGDDFPHFEVRYG